MLLNKTKSSTLIYIVCLLIFSITPAISQSKTVVETLITNKDCNFFFGGLYKPFSDINGQFPVFGKLLVQNGKCVNVANTVPDLFNTGFNIFLSIITLVAVVQISIAGIVWMTQDKSGSKTDAKQKLTNAVIGLILALSAWLILNTVNPRTLNLDVLSLKTGALSQLNGLIQTGINQAQGNITQVASGGCIGADCAGGGGIAADPALVSRYSGAGDVQELLATADNASARSVNGGLNLSLYNSAGDNTTDSNTSAGRGNHNNLLVDGSVALSPDLVTKLNPKHGQEIQVNGVPVGYWDDTTGDNTDPVGKTGIPIINTIDIYNPNNTYGNTNKTLKTIPAGGYQITLGSDIRPQTPKP